MPGRFRWTRDVRFIANTQMHPTATNHGVSQEDAYHLFAYRTILEMARRATTRRQGTPMSISRLTLGERRAGCLVRVNGEHALPGGLLLG